LKTKTLLKTLGFCFFFFTLIAFTTTFTNIKNKTTICKNFFPQKYKKKRFLLKKVKKKVDILFDSGSTVSTLS